jgi:hypothetical protein
VASASTALLALSLSTCDCRLLCMATARVLRVLISELAMANGWGARIVLNATLGAPWPFGTISTLASHRAVRLCGHPMISLLACLLLKFVSMFTCVHTINTATSQRPCTHHSTLCAHPRPVLCFTCCVVVHSERRGMGLETTLLRTSARSLRR